MTSTMNMQGGDNTTKREFYEKIISLLPERALHCLNLGSGISFIFEKLLFEMRGGKDKIDCVDMIDIDEIGIKLPQHVRYTKKNVEEPLSFQKKYDVVFAFEIIEHIDATDIFIKNCLYNLKENGLLFISAPNLSSLYCRIELMLGFQPHLLEISNEYANYGMGKFGKLNNPSGVPLHHIRGITYRAMCELLKANGFVIRKAEGCTNLFHIKSPRIATDVVYMCVKRKSDGNKRIKEGK